MPGAVQRRRGVGESKSAAVEQHNETDRVIAYDPEEERRGENKHSRPVLTLMEEVLLIGLNDEQGYLSFWNDSISYVLRGCILLELALQGKIAVVNDPMRRQHSLSDRLVEVIDDRLTGEVLLDETIKFMKGSDSMSVTSWIDVLSGETWNISKIGYQLKQVRERLAKGLVDKGICRTEKVNFFLFDMATHPVVDFSAKHDIRSRLLHLLSASTYTPEFPDTKFFPKSLPLKTLRTVALAASAYAANVLENLYSTASFDAKDAAFLKVDELLSEYSEFPFASRNTSPWESSVFRSVSSELSDIQNQTQLEVVAAVFRTYSQLDAVV